MSRNDNFKLAVWKEPEQTYAKTYKNEKGKRERYIEYSYFYSMVTRATSLSYKEKFPTYNDVYIEGDLNSYDYFVDWARKQKGFGLKNWELDKDILIPGNKVYSEDTCVFIPAAINSFIAFSRPRKDSTLPHGVSWCVTEGKYKAYCSQLNSRNKTLGRFEKPEDAAQAYREFKNSLALKLADEYKEYLDPRAYNAILNFDVANY